MMKTWLGDLLAQPNFCSTVTVITLRALWLWWKRPKEERGATDINKRHILNRKEQNLGELSSLSITRKFYEWLQKPLEWDFVGFERCQEQMPRCLAKY